MGREKCLIGLGLERKFLTQQTRHQEQNKTRQKKKLRRRAQFCGKVKRRALSKHTRHRVQRTGSEVFMLEGAGELEKSRTEKNNSRK